ncbi:MAG: serine kinase [Pseudomonadota bacterium]
MSIEWLHGTGVVFAGQGVLLLGPSGSGKSALALALIERGAVLISDDRIGLGGTPPHMIAHPQSAGRIEARGLGLFHTASKSSAPLSLVVDLGTRPAQRLPKSNIVWRDDLPVPLWHGKDVPSLATVIWLTLNGRLRGIAVQE